MICIIALVVFGILGIFSASYRVIAKEAFDCVFKRLTLRKCTTGLDKRLKAQITGKLMKSLPKFGAFVYKYFEIISWFFTILLLTSLFLSGQAVYRYAVYGNCNGPNSNEFCIFDPLGSSSNTDSTLCTLTDLPVNKKLEFKGNITGRPSFGPDDANITIVEYGCFACPNTRLAKDGIKGLYDNYRNEVKFVFLSFPLPKHELSMESSLAAECVWENEPDKYWDYYFKLLDADELSINWMRKLAVDVGVDFTTFDACIQSKELSSVIEADKEGGINSNVYGTPTFFINGKPEVGVMDIKDFEQYIEKIKGKP